MRAALVVAVVVGGCGFERSLAPTTDGGVAVVIGFERAASVEDEASGTVMLPVVLSAPAGLPVSVAYEISDGSATRGLDYEGTGGTLQFLAGDTTKHIPITILADGQEEGDETIRVRLRDAMGAELGIDDHTLGISSDILPRVFFTLLQSSGPESEASVQLNVALDVAAPGDVAVDYALSGAASAADYNLASGTIVFPAGITSRTIDLAPIDDLLDEDPEDVIVTLVDPVDVIVKATERTRTHTLTDNDVEPTIGFTATSTTVGEDIATVNLTVSLSAVSGRMVSVPFATTLPPTNPASSADFTLSPSPLQIPAGTPQATIVVTVVDDALDEFLESLAVELGTPTNALLGTADHALSITDDDLPPEVRFDPTEIDRTVSEGVGTVTYKLQLSAPSGKPISVPIQFSGTANTGDYDDDAPVDFAPGDVEQTLNLEIIDDLSVGESNDTIIMDIPGTGNLIDVRQGTPSRRTVTITDNDLL